MPRRARQRGPPFRHQPARQQGQPAPLMSAAFIRLQHLTPQHALSRLVGRFADSTAPRVKDTLIRRFIAAYNVDMSEAAEPASAASWASSTDVTVTATWTSAPCSRSMISAEGQPKVKLTRCARVAATTSSLAS